MKFSKPVVSAAFYVCKEPSGWAMPIDRPTSDKALEEYLAPITVLLAADQFKNSPHAKGDMNYDGITEYLARLQGRRLDEVPMVVVVAFWAQLIQK